MNLGVILTEAIELARRFDIQMPADMTMIARGMSNLEGVIQKIAPSVSVISVLAAVKTGSILDDLDLKKEGLSFAKHLLSSGKSLERLPEQASIVLKRMEQGKTRLQLEMFTSPSSQQRLDSVTQRLISAFLSGCLIIGSMIVRSNSPGIRFTGFALQSVLFWEQLHCSKSNGSQDV